MSLTLEDEHKERCMTVANELQHLSHKVMFATELSDLNAAEQELKHIYNKLEWFVYDLEELERRTELEQLLSEKQNKPEDLT